MDPDPEFVSLHFALAWVYTRNKHFCSEIERYHLWPLDTALADFNEKSPFPLTPVVPSDEDAWELLRDVVVTEQIRLCGFPFRRVREPGLEWRCYTSQIQNVFDIEHLKLDRSHTFPALLSGSSFLTKWERVVVDAKALATFGESASTGPSRSRATEIISSAARECWPNGEWKQLSYKQLHRRVCAWARDHHEEYRDRVEDPISPTSIYRFFNDLRGPKV